MLRAVRENAEAHTDGASTALAGTHDAPFGAAIEPLLIDACGGRLSSIHWFRTDWQRGGALTGYATYQGDSGGDERVVVKLPVPPVERRWLRLLQSAENVAPRLLADGDALGGYDIAWVVMERLPHGPLSGAWHGAEFDLLVEAAGRFYQAAEAIPVNVEPPRRDWHLVLKQARTNVKRDGFPLAQRWTQALKKTQKKLDDWITLWDSHDTLHWRHGDLHLGNALTRAAPPDGPALLIDYARTSPGHWIEDAVYFEHLFWSRPDRLGGRKLCKQIAHERKHRGLSIDDDWPRLAAIRRSLLAMTTPVVMQVDGDARHVEATLCVLEREAG